MDTYKRIVRDRLTMFQNGGIMPGPSSALREAFEHWWAAAHDQVLAAIEEDWAEFREPTSIMILTRRDSGVKHPHMLVAKNFDDVGMEITMLDDALVRTGMRAFDPTAHRRIIHAREHTRQARRRTMRKREG